MHLRLSKLAQLGLASIVGMQQLLHSGEVFILDSNAADRQSGLRVGAGERAFNAILVEPPDVSLHLPGSERLRHALCARHKALNLSGKTSAGSGFSNGDLRLVKCVHLKHAYGAKSTEMGNRGHKACPPGTQDFCRSKPWQRASVSPPVRTPWASSAATPCSSLPIEDSDVRAAQAGQGLQSDSPQRSCVILS